MHHGKEILVPLERDFYCIMSERKLRLIILSPDISEAAVRKCRQHYYTCCFAVKNSTQLSKSTKFILMLAGRRLSPLCCTYFVFYLLCARSWFMACMAIFVHALGDSCSSRLGYLADGSFQSRLSARSGLRSSSLRGKKFGEPASKQAVSICRQLCIGNPFNKRDVRGQGVCTLPFLRARQHWEMPGSNPGFFARFPL